MEALFLTLVAAVLFTQAWYLLGMFADPRTMGLIAGGLALGLLLTAAAGSMSAPVVISPDGDTAPLLAAVRGLILLWAVYAAALAAHGLWGFEERALGFHALLLWVLALIILSLPFTVFTESDQLSGDGAIVISASSLVLAVLPAMVFFHIAVPFRELKAVTAWFLLVGSIVVFAVGLSVFFGFGALA